MQGIAKVDVLQSFSLIKQAQSISIQYSSADSQKDLKRLRAQKFRLSQQDMGQSSNRSRNIISSDSTPQQLYFDMRV